MSKRRTRDWYRAARATGRYPLTFNFVLINRDRFVQCSLCGKWILEKEVTRDHIYPKSRGGEIKTPACLPCNQDKEDMLPIDWAIYAAKEGKDLAVIPIGFET